MTEVHTRSCGMSHSTRRSNQPSSESGGGLPLGRGCVYGRAARGRSSGACGHASVH